MAKKVRKLHVTVKPVRLDGLRASPGEKNVFAMVELKWKGPVSGFGLGLVPFYRSNRPVNHTTMKPIASGVSHLEWEEEFERVCCVIGPWNLSFNVFIGETMDSKSKKITLVGKASLDLSRLESVVERKLPIRSKGLLAKEATLLVKVTLSELRNKFVQLDQILIDSAIPKKVASRDFESPENQSEPSQKAGFDWWKRRRLSFSMTWRREPVIDRTDLWIDTNKWVMKDFVSRDGKSKLRTQVYSASIDQRSEKAGGEAACAAVAVVVAHWFVANPRLINPSGTEFDSLIKQGSSLWQSLCYEQLYLRLFPNRHFDLETIVSANLKPIRLCTDRSFTGVFSPESFASLEGLMSFDQIWDEVEKEVSIASRSGEPRVYIVSWNDHFFVVKADLHGYCVIDSLGERLFEGCTQAYILKFDYSSLMYEKLESSEKLVSKGKECCRDYMKRFLAAIPVAELVGNVVDVSFLHEKLQIDLHHIMLAVR